jgi:hypothetical protein
MDPRYLLYFMLRYSKFVLIFMRLRQMQITERSEVATVGSRVLNDPVASTATETKPAKAYFSKLQSDPILNYQQLCNVKFNQQV